MRFQELLLKRQSCRNYDPARPVAEEAVLACAEAMRLAPSACNAQPYEITVCRGETAQVVAKATQGMGMNKFASQADVLLVGPEAVLTLALKDGLAPCMAAGVEDNCLTSLAFCTETLNNLIRLS